MPLQRPKKFSGRHRRKGAALVEFAIVGPLLLLLLIGFAVLATGVFRYQQIAYLAREGARYASTHGAQYRADQRLPEGDQEVWTQDILDNAILTQMTALDPSRLTVSASWTTGDNRANAGDRSDDFRSTINNSVTVTVSYQWSPEAYVARPITLSSTTTMPMAY